MSKHQKLIFIFLFIITTTAYAVLTPGIKKFNGGEFSPQMLARNQFVKYDNACKTLQNMLVLSQGPVQRRPGTKFIATTKSNGIARLIPFEFSKTDTYMLLFGDENMRAFRNGGLILDGDDPFELTTVYTADQLRQIQFVQSADIMWLVHPDHPPQELTRTDHTEWTIADSAIVTGPFLPKNTTTTTITPSAKTGTVTLTASSAIFTANHVGALWQLTHVVDNSSVNGSFSTTGNSSTISVLKNQEFIFTTHGTWTGTVILQRSFDSGSTWRDVLTRHYEGDGNLDFSESEKRDDALYRVRMDSHSSGTLDFNFEALTIALDGVVKITAFASSTSVTASVQSTLGNTAATEEWAEGYLSDENGWPATVEFHEERLAYGGNTNYPQTVWLSQTRDFIEFTAGALAADALIYTLPGQNPIQWMRSQDFLFVGTLGGVGRLGGNSPHDALSAEPGEIPTYKQQSYAGSMNLQAAIANESILFAERGGREISEFVFSIESDKYVANDLTVLAEHITESGIVEIAFQERPQPILWCVRDDGVLLSLTYKLSEDVVAWTRHVTDGEFESVGVIAGTEEDEVWVIVNRTIEGSTKRYVELFQPLDWGTDDTDIWFADSALQFDGGPAVNITNITKADPAVVRVSSYPVDGDGDDLEDGDQIKIRSVSGMTEVNDRIYTISNPNVSAKTLELRDSTDVVDIDSTGFTAYGGGGTAQRFEKTFGGLSHLEGEVVVVLVDGMTHTDETVSNASITTDIWANKVLAGKEYTSILETMPIVFASSTGSTMAQIKRISKVTFDFYKTLGTEYGVDADNLRPINFQTTQTPMGDAIPLHTGFAPGSFSHGYKKQSTVYIQQTLPLPMTVRAIVPEIEIY